MELTKDNQIDDSWSLMHGYDTTLCSREKKHQIITISLLDITKSQLNVMTLHWALHCLGIFTQPESNIISLLTLIFGENNTRLSCESAARYG
jgi:hypothetical protein